jgi:hypothetical protein
MRLRNLLLLVCVALVLVPFAALAQNHEEMAEGSPPPGDRRWETEVYHEFSAPHLVQSYAVVCHSSAVAPSLLVGIRDCCMPGDQWDVKGHFYDANPMDVGVCGGGGITGYRSVLGSGAGQPLRAIVNIRYAQGINDWPAGGWARFTCLPRDSIIEVTDLGQRPDLR